MAKILIKVNAEKCKGCGLCVSVCPKDVFSISKDKKSLNKAGHYAAGAERPDQCIACLGCALICPDGAIGLYEEQASGA